MDVLGTRSGNAALDALIEEYLAAAYWYDCDEDSPYLSMRELLDAWDAEEEQIEAEHGPDALVVPQTPLPARLLALRDPDNAESNCEAVARNFVAFLRSRGLAATVVDGNAADLYPELDDMSLRRGAAHTWAEVETADDVFAVDWTAAQYGRTEFPAVAKKTSPPQS